MSLTPVGLIDDPETFPALNVKHIKNWRLAVLSMFGYYVQAIVTCEGPSENWGAHIADPFAVNGLSINYAPQFSPLSVAMLAATCKRSVDKLAAWYGPPVRSGWSLSRTAPLPN